MPHFPKPWFRADRGRWFVQVGGKQHNLGSDREAAFERYHALMRRPKSVALSSESVVAVLDAFLEWTSEHRANATYRWYCEKTQSFVESLPASLSVQSLTPLHVQKWVDAHPNWSSGMKRGCIIAVQRAFNWATRQGYVERNPIRGIEKPRAGKRTAVVSEADFAAILSHFRDQEFRDLLTVAWDTGARPQELLRVEARHVDSANARWVIPPEEAKVKTQPRIVYLTERALEITLRLMAKHPEGKLFRNEDGNPWTPWAVNCRFQRFKKHTGKSFCLYLFRHTFANRMLEKGTDVLSVAILLGHKNPAMLSTTYQHLGHSKQFLIDQLRRGASTSAVASKE